MRPDETASEQQEIVVAEGAAAEIEQLGLTLEGIIEAVRIGEAARRGATANDPPTMAGYLAWATKVRVLREMYAAAGWYRRDVGLSTLVSPDGKMAVAVATGDKETGLPTSTPATKNRKGSATRKAVQRNNEQLPLPFPCGTETAPPPPVVPEKEVEAVTWFLLVHPTPTEVRAELSLPMSLDEETGRVVGWRRRILLASIPLDLPSDVERNLEHDDGAYEELDIDVARK